MTASNSFSVAVLDDYQRVARGLADWATLSPQAETVFFHDHAGEGDQLIARLRPFDILVLMRERTRIDAATIERLPKLRLIVTVGAWNAAIDMDAAQRKGIVVCGTEGGGPHGPSALTWALFWPSRATSLPRRRRSRLEAGGRSRGRARRQDPGPARPREAGPSGGRLRPCLRHAGDCLEPRKSNAREGSRGRRGVGREGRAFPPFRRIEHPSTS